MSDPVQVVCYFHVDPWNTILSTSYTPADNTNKLPSTTTFTHHGATAITLHKNNTLISRLLKSNTRKLPHASNLSLFQTTGVQYFSFRIHSISRQWGGVISVPLAACLLSSCWVSHFFKFSVLIICKYQSLQSPSFKFLPSIPSWMCSNAHVFDLPRPTLWCRIISLSHSTGLPWAIDSNSVAQEIFLNAIWIFITIKTINCS